MIQLMKTDTITLIQEIENSSEFNQLLTKDKDLFLILFYTQSSEKSYKALEVLKNLKQSNEDIEIYKVDARLVPDIHPRFNIHSVPTLVAFRNGKKAEVIPGVQTKSFYARILQKQAWGNTEEGSGSSHRITVYTTPTCPYCTAVKQYLTSKNMAYSEIDVASDQQAAEELVQRTGQQGVPQTEIDGSYVIGFNKSKIDRLLNL